MNSGTLTFLRTKLKEEFVKCETCPECQEFKATEIHHKDKDSGNNEHYNLMLLCKQCHLRMHYTIKKKIGHGNRHLQKVFLR